MVEATKAAPQSTTSTRQSEENAAWLLETETVISRLGVDPQKGLTDSEAADRLERYGENALIEKGVESPWKILLAQLADPLVLILIGAAVISGLLGEFKSVIAISLIVVANAALGVSQEYRAEKAIAALQKMSAPIVRARRNGLEQELAPNLLVPGDIVLLEAGSIVPADSRVIESYNMSVQEASLTGESLPVEKSTGLLVNPNTPLGDRVNMVYMGTSVTYGRGLVLVTSTGQNTELGHIATMIQEVESEQTPLQRRMSELSIALFYLSIGIVVVGTVLGLLNGGTLADTFLNGVAMAVAVVPEGLPAVVTIALALGAQRMLRRKALIRKLPAVETLGSVTTIASDKTGTLTQNKMTARHIYYVGGRDILDGREMTGEQVFKTEIEGAVVLASALCNDSLRQNNMLIGDPTETALVDLAEKFGMRKDELESILPRVGEVPFSSERKRMTTIHEVKQIPFLNVLSPDGSAEKTPILRKTHPRYIAFMKGAVDSMLEVSKDVHVLGTTRSLDEREAHPEFNPDGSMSFRERILKQDSEAAEKGLRDLGFAYRYLDELPEKIDIDSIEHDFVFLGRVAMIDPPRPEVKDAVARCVTAGIRPVMITGDHPATAFAIARELGIVKDENYAAAKLAGHVYTGRELTLMNEAALQEAVKKGAVFARVSPEHKLNIVQALQSQHEIVAMTGDGVNDAPALKKADIGVAMGITGTPVTKEASAMVILDDNFATIVSAAEEGRTIYNNVRKFIKYILGSNIGEVGVLFIAQFLRLPLPVNTLQILWMNLVTDGLPALALSIEKGETDSMQRPPYNPRESIFSRGLGAYLGRAGMLIGIMGLATVLMLPVLRADGTLDTFGQEVISRLQGVELAVPTEAGLALWSTMVFTTLVFVQMGHALAIRSERFPIWKIGYGSNKAVIGAISLTVALQIALLYVPFLQDFFGTVALPPVGFLLCVILAVITYFAVEADKWVDRRYNKR